MNRNIFFLIAFFFCSNLQIVAQNDTINWLDEVRLSDVKLKSYSKGQLVQVLGEADIQKSAPSLTSLLKFNSPFFFRENGQGMVSSISVRGTGAAQTAVIWNGVNINSQFTGQTDFNTINTRGFENISLKPGGGSVIYGSGAIGGSVHLNNVFQFDEKSNNKLRLGYGSFETYQASYKGSFSNDKTSLNIGLGSVMSENNYSYPRTGAVNENGDFYNISLDASFAHWMGENNIVKFYSNYYQGARGFSGTLDRPSRSKYEDKNSRNLMEWKYFMGKLTSNLKLAWIEEEFKYFENRNLSNFSVGKVQSAIIKYDLGYEISENIKLNVLADYNKVTGEGTGIGDAQRRIGGLSVLWSHGLNDFQYQFSLRQEAAEGYESPLLFSVGTSYKITDGYFIRFNTSRNFRVPTFNDLFWQEGGNVDLNPETSLQAEIGNEFHFDELSFNLTGYIIDINDLIRWIPDSTGVWRPINTAESYNYGLELFSGYETSMGEGFLSLNGSYGYSRAIDKETKSQLIYTPKHKATFSAGYNLGELELILQSLYNGRIYTSTDNEYELDGYYLMNLGIAYSIMPGITLQVNMDNLLNKKYQSLPSRIMPGRSIQTHLTFNF